MTNNAVWSRSAYPAGSDYDFSFDRLTATPNSGISGQGIVYTSAAITQRTVFFIQVAEIYGYVDIGLITTGSTGGAPPDTGLVVATSGGSIYYSPGGASYSSVGSVGASAAPGDWIGIAFDPGVGAGTSGTCQVWACLVHGGVAGQWNNSGTANPDTNTGGIAVSALGASALAAAWMQSPVGCQVVLNSGGSAYPGGIALTTFANLPITQADVILNLVGVSCFIGQFTAINWAAINGSLAGTLQYQLDGGTWTNCTGDVTGTGGQAYGPVISDGNVHSIAIRDGGYTADFTPIQYFQAAPLGQILINEVVELKGGEATSGTLYLSQESSSFSFNLSIFESYTDDEFYCDVYLNLYNSGAQQARFSPSLQWHNDGTHEFTGNWGSAVDLPVFSGVGSSWTINGTVEGIAIVDGNAVGALNAVDSLGNTYSNSAFQFWPTTDLYQFAFIVAENGGTEDTVNEVGLAISQAYDPPETLTITSASAVAGGTLSVAGDFSNAPLEYVNVSTSNGATFALGVDTSITGSTSGSYATSSSYTLSAGTYEVVTQDAQTGVESEPYELVVEAAGNHPYAVLNCVMS